MARKVPVVRPRAERTKDEMYDELIAEIDAFGRRQSIHAVKDERYELPKLPRDWRLIVAMSCGVVAGMGFVAVLIVAIVTSR